MLNKYGDLIESCVLLTASGVFLLSTAAPAIVPPIAGSAGFAALNFAGLLSFPFQWEQVKKYIGDLKLAYHLDNRAIMASSALKTAFTALGILMTASWTGAALFRLAGGFNITAKMYKILRPVSVTALVESIGMNIFDAFRSRSTVKKMQGLSQEEQEGLHDAFLGCSYSPEALLAADIRGQTDKNTWNVFKERLGEGEFDSKLEQLRSNLENQSRFAGARLAETALGYGGVAVSDIFPGTVVDATSRFGFSLYYTGRLAVEKILEYQKQKALHLQENGCEV